MLIDTLKLLSLSEWRAPIAKARRLGLFRRREIAAIGVISVITVVFETFGMGMLLPVLQFVEHEGRIERLIADSRLWRILADAFDLVGQDITLLGLSAVVLFMLIMRQAVATGRALLVEVIRARAARSLSERCFAAIMSARGEYIQTVGSGTFSVIVGTQAQSGASILRSLSEVWSNTITLIGYAVIMAVIALVPALIALAAGLLIMLGISGLIGMTRHASKSFVDAKAAFSQHLVERLTAWRLIKTTNSEDFERGLARRHANKLAGLDIRIAKISNMMTFVVVAGQAFLLLLVLNISVGVLEIELSAITLLFLAMFRMMPIFTSFGRLRQSTAANEAYLTQVLSYMDASVEHREIDTGRQTFPGVSKGIEFRNVEFTYARGGAPVLNDLSVSIPAGQITAITGPSGAGKSTLVDMLPRLILPQRGEVRIDGVPINEIVLSELRANLHYVGQTPMLINGSVADNVRYARQEASLVEVIEACCLARADEFVSAMPNGYDTEVGEGGTLLSGGQRQRLAIARAFLSDAQVIVLDEPTSALDYESEAKIHEALRDLVAKRNATVIVIAHRASTVLNSDYVIALDEGKLARCGATKTITREQSWLRDMVDGGEPFAPETVEPR
ncbi:MAG TPA: ABC transporter ATP-binding protein [Thermohalobaculum sp.]|nr:ABC transporter ATP-binding protein [Thermohalobaculum sp.]